MNEPRGEGGKTWDKRSGSESGETGLTASCFLSALSGSEDGADAQSVLHEATDLLHTKFGFHSITIQVELYSEDMSHCSHCQDPRD